MTDNNSRDVPTKEQDTHPQDTPPPEETGKPVRLVRGTASPEELSALIAVVAVLAAGDGDEPDESDTPSARGGTSPRSQWSAPIRMVRQAHLPGPGGWRASASPR